MSVSVKVKCNVPDLGSVVKNSPANAGDVDSIPGPVQSARRAPPAEQTTLKKGLRVRGKDSERPRHRRIKRKACKRAKRA